MAVAPPAPGVDRLGQLTDELLGVAVRGLEAAGESVVSYVSPGLPVLGDYLGRPPCSNSVVAAFVANIGREPVTPSGQLNSEMQHRYAWLSMAQVTFTYGRCIQVFQRGQGLVPRAAQQSDDGRLLQRAEWAMWNALNYGIRHGYALDGCKQYRMGQVVPLAPSGGIAGFTLTVGFQLDGFDPFRDDAP